MTGGEDAMSNMATIQPHELKDALDRGDDLLLVNVLSEASFRKEHIPGSENIPFPSTEHFVDEVARLAGSRGRRIIVYCAGPNCQASDEAARALRDADFTNVTRFEGGLREWKRARYPVQTGVPAGARR